MGPQDDQIDRLRAGDAGACEQFVREHALELYGWLYRLTGRREEAEDLAQEALTGFWESIRRKRPPVRRIWLFSIARNVWRQHCRRRAGRPQPERLLSEAILARGRSALEVLENEETIGVVEAAVAELDAEFREVFSLRVWHDLAYAEIAAIQGVSPGLIRWRFFRARQKLRARLGPEFDTCEKSHD